MTTTTILPPAPTLAAPVLSQEACEAGRQIYLALTALPILREMLAKQQQRIADLEEENARLRAEASVSVRTVRVAARAI